MPTGVLCGTHSWVGDWPKLDEVGEMQVKSGNILSVLRSTFCQAIEGSFWCFIMCLPTLNPKSENLSPKS